RRAADPARETMGAAAAQIGLKRAIEKRPSRFIRRARAAKVARERFCCAFWLMMQDARNLWRSTKAQAMTRWTVPLPKRFDDGVSPRPAMVKKPWKAGSGFRWIFTSPIAIPDKKGGL